MDSCLGRGFFQEPILRTADGASGFFFVVVFSSYFLQAVVLITSTRLTARTYIQQLCEDTGCSPEDLPESKTIGMGGERGSGISVLMARQDDFNTLAKCMTLIILLPAMGK